MSAPITITKIRSFIFSAKDFDEEMNAVLHDIAHNNTDAVIKDIKITNEPLEESGPQFIGIVIYTVVE